MNPFQGLLKGGSASAGGSGNFSGLGGRLQQAESTRLTPPAPPSFKDTPQGQKFRSIFSQADQQTKAQIFNHLTNAAKAGNQKSYDQLQAIRDIVRTPTQNPVQTQGPFGNNGLLNSLSNYATQNIAQPAIRGGQALTALQGNQFQGQHNKVDTRQFIADAINTGLNFAPVGAAGKAASLIGKAGKGAVVGAAIGGGQGVANAIQDHGSIGHSIGDVAAGIGVGAASGAGLSVGGAALRDALHNVQIAKNPIKPSTKLALVQHLQDAGQTDAAQAVKDVKTVGGARVALEHAKDPSIATIPVNKLTTYEGAPDKGAILGYKNAIQEGKPIEPIKIKIGSDGALGVEDGKHRLAAYKELGFKEVPVQEVSVPKPEGPITPAASEKPSVAQSPTLLKGEQGAVNPGQAIKDVQGLITKHQASAPFSEDITQSSRAAEGNKKIIQNDAAGVIKGHQALSTEDKATLQEYRDRKAAGLPVQELPARLQAEDRAVTALNVQAQRHDAELARLNGQEAKAKTIEARNPETYTHRVAQGKGSAFDYLLQGDRKSPIQVSSLGKSKPGDKARVFHAVTDEQGNRKLVAIKNHTVKVEGKTVARGKLVTAIDENGKGTELGKMKLKSKEDLLKTETKPFQDKLKKLQSEYKALDNVKIKDQFPTARFNALAKKAALLEDTKNFSGLNKAEQKSLNAAVTKAKELMKIKPGGSNVPGRLAKLDEAITHLSTTIDQITEHYNPAELNDRVFVGNDGQRYTVGQATTSEITRATGQKYYVDPQLTALANYVESRSALENARFIDHIKTSPDFENFGVGPDATAPKGWKPVNGMMQFQGYKFEPRVAEALQAIAGSGMNEKNILDQAGRFLRQTIVYFPLKHDINMAAAYVVDRGLTNTVNPFALRRMGSSLYQAMREVINQGPRYQQALRAGFSMPSADNKAFEEAFNKELKKIVDNKSVLDPIAKQILTTPKRLADAYSTFQHTTVWELQDILNLARVIERTQSGPLKKGLSFEEALKQTGRFNFQYQVPPRVAGSRQLANLLTSDKVFFGRYRYDQWKILSNIVKDSVNLKNPAQAAQSWDKLAMLALGTAVLWPMVNKGLQDFTGQPNAKMTAPGPLGIPEQILNAATGKGNWRSAVTNQLYLSGALSLGIQVYDNRDSFTGKNIADPNASPADQAKQTVAWIGGQMAPSQKFTQVKGTSGNQLLNAALSLAGVSFPKNNAASQKVSSLQFDSLPLVQAQAKALAAKGDKQGAQQAIDKYDQQVLAASKAAFAQSHKAAPPDDQLIKSLKQQHIWYAPKQKTIDSWTSTTPTGSLTDKLSTIKSKKK